MTLHLVGMTHHTASMSVLDAAALPTEVAVRAATRLRGIAAESVVLATCNRLEAYVVTPDDADPDAVGRDVAEVLAGHGSLNESDFISQAFVLQGEDAVDHLLTVAAGLDSMVVGEPQVLGQVRAAIVQGRHAGTVGPELSSLFDTALRVGKRVRAETGLQRAGGDIAAQAIRMLLEAGVDLTGSRVLLVGAGSMASLAGHAVVEHDVAEVLVISRSPSSAGSLAHALGGRAESIDVLQENLGSVDVVMTCAGTRGELVTADMVRAALAGRPADRGELVVLDLAVPHDVDRSIADIPGVLLRGLEDIPTSTADSVDEARARSVVVEGLQEFTAWRREAGAASTVVALRTLGEDIVAGELARLRARLPGLPDEVAAEVETSVRRVAAKLLHQPTVRVKQAAGAGDGDEVQSAVRHLFALADTEEDDTQHSAATSMAAAVGSAAVAAAARSGPARDGAS
jgi:glutamyl-tRNA reductase